MGGAAWHASDLGTADSQSVPIDREEPGGTAVVESLALGTPVVGYQRGCLPELVEHGRTGFLVGPGDEDALGDAVRRSGEIDPQDGRRVAAARFTPAHMADRYLRL